jgi:uncharacterized protein YndB with AHSA1/START domain
MSAIRQHINIAVPVRTVWRAITTPDGLSSWWADEARIEARAGGRVVVVTEGDDGEPVEERGMLHRIQPTRVMEIAWDSNSPAATRGTRIMFQVARSGEETRLRVVHSGAGVLDDDEARAEIEKDWKRALLALRSSLEGE